MTPNTQDDYVALIPQQNAEQPKFVAMVRLLVEASVQLQRVVSDIPRNYDLDTAIGAQLDIIGEWVGISRLIPVPITDVYFTFDGTDALGWDGGLWQGPFDPSAGPVLLNDDAYRRLIRTKILINQWDGSQEQMLAIWNQFLPPDKPGIIVDNQDMTISLGFEGGPLTPLQLAMLEIALPLLKPAGVSILEVFSATGDAPLLSWDSEPGWDVAEWSVLINT